MLPFGTPASTSTPFWSNSPRAWAAALAAFVAAILMFRLAQPILLDAIDPAATEKASLHPLIGGLFGTYQIALLGWIAVCMIAYAAIWRIALTEH